MLARTLTGRVVQPGTKPNLDPHPPRGCPSNSLGPVWANMYSDPRSTTMPAAVGIDNPDCVKWRETRFRSFVLTLFIFKALNYMLALTLTERVI